MKKLLLVSFILAFLTSCKDASAIEPFGNTCYFESPQPKNDSELISIPNKFHGIFMDSDSSYVNIKENIILTEKKYTLYVNKQHLDSLKDDFEIIDGKFISKISKEIYNYRELKDSVQLTSKRIDTFFIFSNSQKAKRINGHLILNEKDSIFWSAKIINLFKNKLTIKQIYSQEDLKRMDSLIKIKSKMIDSSTFILNPSRREFKKFLDLKNFGYEQQFIKIYK